MRDSRSLRLLKRLALWNFRVDLAIHRLLRRLRGRPVFVLAGACRRNAACCEAPSIQVVRLVWYLPTFRRLFLWWQRRVNGFDFHARDAASRVFVFRCTHFDWTTRSCDSYDSRPAMCRDYPRMLLEQPDPEFFPGCGFRAVARAAERWKRILDAQSLTPEQRQHLKRGLRLE